MLTRREVLAISGVGVVVGGGLNAAAAEFWDRKDPKDWTQEEIDLLLTRSPWAKQVTASSATGVVGGLPRPGVGIGGIGLGMGRRRGNPVPHAASGKATVRWESAEPIRDAAKTALPEGFKEHYVLGVWGLEAGGDVDDLKQFATLEPRAGNWLKPESRKLDRVRPRVSF